MYIGIYGPTASGKTDLSMKITEKINGVLINFDSCQFYNMLPSLTMLPTPSIYKEYFFGFLNEDETFSAGKFIEETKEILRMENGPKIFVGGSGFYLFCLQNGITKQLDRDEKILIEIENRSIEENYELLNKLNPNNKIHKNDHYRIKNHLYYGLKHFNKNINEILTPPLISKEKMFNIFLNPSKEWLWNRIELRTQLYFLKMVNEVEVFRKNNPSFKTHIIGYNEINQYLDGVISMETAKEKINIKTRQYSKQQKVFCKYKLKSDLIIGENYNLEEIMWAYNNFKEFKEKNQLS